MANLRISELDQAPLVSGTYVFPASSVDSTYKISFDQLSSWITSKEVKNNAGNYTVGSFDTKTIVTFNNSQPVLFTIPNDSNQYLPIGTTIELIRLGAGIVNITGGSNVIVNSSVGWTLRGVYSKATVSKINGNTWIVSGDLALSPTPTPTISPTVTPTITPSPTSAPFGPPSVPLNLLGFGGNEEILLYWNDPATNNRLPITNYVVEYEIPPDITPTVTRTPTVTPTVSATPTVTPTNTSTETPTPTVTPTISASPTPTLTPPPTQDISPIITITSQPSWNGSNFTVGASVTGGGALSYIWQYSYDGYSWTSYSGGSVSQYGVYTASINVCGLSYAGGEPPFNSANKDNRYFRVIVSSSGASSATSNIATYNWGDCS